MSDLLNNLTNELHQSGSLKVWSLIMTFYGDSIMPRGDSCSVATVQTVLEQMNIGSGAVRTAFSRLAKDGWLCREKFGRRSYYQLSTDSLQQFEEATNRIYSPNNAAEGVTTWALGLHNRNDADGSNLPDTAILLTGRSVLIANPSDDDISRMKTSGLLVLEGSLQHVPEWITERLCTEDWRTQMHQLRISFEPVLLQKIEDPLEALVFRTLLIHQWRRLLLRQPVLPDEIKGKYAHNERECRQFVADLYHHLCPTAEMWLKQEADGFEPEYITTAIPADRFTARF